MSYLVLARKSRPQCFAEVVGQKAVVRTLQNALGQGRVAHALLFSGVRGTGKTTLARIMAKALNCERGPAPEPCNQCRSCRDIMDGSSIDLQEVDGASNRGIQEIRELKEKIRFLPTSCRYKIILIDEVHMLTTEAFNALLKTLEEPPEHVYFMFATTEAHKIPITILSRCQRYELKRLGHRDLAGHFSRLAKEEGVDMEPAAVEMIVREAGGSVRDGLSLLDQVFAYCGNRVLADEVVEVLGLVSHQAVAELGTALLAGDLANVYRLLDEIYRQGMDIKRFANELLTWFRGLILCKVSASPEHMLEESEDTIRMMISTAAAYPLTTLTALFNLLLEGLEQTLGSQQPRMALEMTFLKAVQYGDVIPVSELIGRLDRLLGQTAGTNGPAGTGRLRSAPGTALNQGTRAASSPSQTSPVPDLPQPIPSEPVSVAEIPSPAQDHVQDQAEAQAAKDAPALPSPAGEAVKAPVSAQAGESKKRVRQHWDVFLKFIRERQPWIAASLQMASSVERKGEELVIRFEDSVDCSMLKHPPNITSLTEYVLDFFQENLKVQFVVPGSDACAIAPGNGLAPQQERRALANDPLVLTALEVFTGQVGDIRVGASYRADSTPGREPAQDEEPNTSEE